MGRRHEVPGRQRQRGIALLLYATGALAVVGAAGLALDVGTAYIRRAQLQNALDAAALAGAYTLATTHSSADAIAQANATYTLNAAPLPATPAPVVDVSPTLDPWVSGGLSAAYVKVTVTDLGSPTYFSSVLGLSTFTMSGSAVAGLKPLGAIENTLPVALCGDDADIDCSDGACYGLGPGEMEIKSNNTRLGPGNYGLLEIDCATGGADCVREGMAGGAELEVSVGGTVTTEPGGAAGPTSQGVNTRFGEYKGSMSSADYPSDVVTTSPLTYDAYALLLGNRALWNNPGGVPQRRIAAAPVVECDPPINGKSDATVVGTVCLFLTRTVAAGNGTIYGEVVPSCLVEGGGAPPGGGGGGPSTIVLYQDI